MNDNLFYRRGKGKYKKPKELGDKKDVLAKVKIALYIILSVCVFLLLFKGFTTLYDRIKSSTVEQLATINVVAGEVQLSSMNSGNYVNVYSGEKLWVTDKLRTLSNSRAVVTLFDGTQVRMDESTVISFSRLEKSGNNVFLNLNVDTGNIWVNTPQVLVGNTEINVSTRYTRSKFNNAIVAFTSNLPEFVRVVSGNVQVGIVENNSNLQNLTLSSGQQLNLSNANFENVRRGQVVEGLVSDFDNRFSFSQWLRWNSEQDINPSYGLNSRVVIDPSQTVQDQILFDKDLNSEFVETTKDGVDPLIQPVFTSHKDGEVVKGVEIVELRGTVPAGTTNVMIVSYENGVANPTRYVLRGFKEGDTTFLYRAQYKPPVGNLSEGDNVFEAIAIDGRGQESLATKITINYEPKVEVVTDNSSSNNNSNSLINLTVNEDLQPLAQILTVNDVAFTENFVLDETRGVIKGSIGKWARYVVVNGFRLTLYEEYSGEFQYILSPGFENVKKGLNTLQIYGIDKDGNRSRMSEFKIDYK